MAAAFLKIFEMLTKKKYDRLDQTLKFVERKNELDPFDDDDTLRAEMSCGHAVTPESLTLWCRTQLTEGNFKFTCPALVEGTKRCNKEWSYQEVRRMADLSCEEMQYFESAIARLAAQQHHDSQPCPQCKTMVTRMDLNNLCVQCPICTADEGQTYMFCWQCMKQWKGRGPRSDRCDNEGCINNDLQLLETCKLISLPKVKGAHRCPSIRACPTCGLRVEHSRAYCKHITCPRCQVKFCFLCLKLADQCRSPYEVCPQGVAPRQTAIPVWQNKT